ncbi:hypothetical protein [Bacillus sp. UMB0893]|uniref:hypothetical protein n=1 Tax=Bacillus sp. UMB0893 TaxID=2066053 RepID=UPI000C7896F0|nr:hypothetical protein [Bacillus sp. UMB0893]PLR65567.1 hypothetical protein CYJ36_23170 [Bacillus sp. UMB0893]
MSWEETYRRTKPCSCGEGTITEVGEGDDWNRHREYQTIDCPTCKEEARKAAVKAAEIKAEEEARLKELISEINIHFEQHYMDEWLSLFGSAKSKRAIWTLAKKLGVESYSLASFYQHNKRSNKEDYVRRLARPHNMLKIMEALDKKDSSFESKVKEARMLNGPYYMM